MDLRSSFRVLASKVFAPLPSAKNGQSFGYWMVYVFLVLPIRWLSFVSVAVCVFAVLSLSSSSASFQLDCESGEADAVACDASFVFALRRLVRVDGNCLLSFLWARPLASLVLGFCTLETGFSIYYLYCKHKLQALSHPVPYFPSRLKVFHQIRFLVKDFRRFLSSWFFNADMSVVHVEDLNEWLGWAFFHKKCHEMTEEELTELSEMVDSLRKETQLAIAPGASSKICIKHTFDPVTSISRPLVFYIVTMSANWLLSAPPLRYLGFSYHRLPALNYWIYQPANTGTVDSDRNRPMKKKDPIFFVHGIGIGISMYLPLIFSLLRRYEDRTIILIELSHVSMQLGTSESIPSKSQTLDAINTMYDLYNFKRAVWIGHSIGSVITGWMIKDHYERVSRTVLIDPVIFKLWEVDVVYNFLYKSPRSAVDLLMHYFVSKELYISHYLQRHFWWYENVLFPNELPKKSKIFLSEQDTIVNSSALRQYLTEHSIDNHVWPALKHGEFIFSPSAFHDVASSLKE